MQHQRARRTVCQSGMDRFRISIDVCSDDAVHDDLIDCRAVKIKLIIHSRLVNRSWVSCVSMRIYTTLMSVSERPAVPQD